MKNRSVFLMFFLMGLVILFVPGCKTGEDAQYTLTVTVGEGIMGMPAAGSYSYSENETVSFNYSSQSGYGNLEV